MGRLDELLLVHGSIRLHVFYWGVAVQDKSKRTKQVRDGRQRSRWHVRRMHRGYIGVLWSKRREDSLGRHTPNRSPPLVVLGVGVSWHMPEVKHLHVQEKEWR